MVRIPPIIYERKLFMWAFWFIFFRNFRRKSSGPYQFKCRKPDKLFWFIIHNKFNQKTALITDLMYFNFLKDFPDSHSTSCGEFFLLFLLLWWFGYGMNRDLCYNFYYSMRLVIFFMQWKTEREQCPMSDWVCAEVLRK